MVYDMVPSWTAPVLLIIVLLAAAGCLDRFPGSAANPTPTPLPITVPPTENPRISAQPSEMALQLADLPTDYILRDRSVMVSPEVTQLSRDLGWREGYFVVFYRTNEEKDDRTKVRQSISVFPLENMKKVFDLEKIDIENQVVSPVIQSEIPFPLIGENSRAYRETDPTDARKEVAYTVIFTKKNVYERITMVGTSTDYEALKDIVQKAAEKIH
jgi:hypothetical protein